MVYCGKPSRGCQMCRTRRIKCDETKPTCNQCAKSRRVCPGYKDDFDLVFRNETQATERRARRAVNGKRTAGQISFATQQASFPSIKTDDSSPKREPTLIAPNPGRQVSDALILTSLPAQSLDLQVPAFFVTNFVEAPQYQARGYFDFLLPMLKNESTSAPLYLAFSAVAMASFANRPNTRGQTWLFDQAIGQYTKALKATNIALQSSVHQKSDQTLASILMLGFFETIASEKTNAMAWFSHIDGATQLVKMRGRKQLRTKIGYSLFRAVRQHMIVSSLVGSKALTMGTEWWTSDTTKDERGNFVTKLNCRVAELRADLNAVLANIQGNPEYSSEIINLMRRAQALENEYMDFEATLPEDYFPRTVVWIDQVPGADITQLNIFPGKVDMYPDASIANLWNEARVARLFISGVIVRCAAWVCNPVDYRTTPEYATAVRLCTDLNTDIIASVPYHLGWRMDDRGELRPGMPAEGEPGNAGAIGGFFVMWPLFSISNTDYISDSQRAWVKGRLMYISESLGLNHAKVLSNYHLRLPSMLIRRDNMSRTTSSPQPQGVAQYTTLPIHTVPTPSPSSFPTTTPTYNSYTRGYSPPTSDPSPHITTSTISSLAAANGYMDPIPRSPEMMSGYGNGGGISGGNGYMMSPHQQREALLRESWERERKMLLEKASNSQGESVERLLANYFAV